MLGNPLGLVYLDICKDSQPLSNPHQYSRGQLRQLDVAHSPPLSTNSERNALLVALMVSNSMCMLLTNKWTGQISLGEFHITTPISSFSASSPTELSVVAMQQLRSNLFLLQVPFS